ncbi:MAG: hypothetical protein M0R03_23370 [Novosphingobium sp.]|nr:hypothetical protein [Novosphingobium sp.]
MNEEIRNKLPFWSQEILKMLEESKKAKLKPIVETNTGGGSNENKKTN